MQISRRNALMGASAAAMVAGVPTSALARADPQIKALIGQLRAANALLENINILYDAATALIPRAATEAIDAYPNPSAAPQDVRDTYNRHYEASGAKELAEESEIVCARETDIEVQIIQTPATTLRGALDKARVAWHITAEHENLDETDPDLSYGLGDPRLIWSALQDLERLAGGHDGGQAIETSGHGQVRYDWLLDCRAALCSGRIQS